ncbi:glycosyltransferase [Pontibacter beigongshangensis]|uniref:glycosyltransferase n=1 Tax=Pontibacter beigongshangensis TaxID=2574733 RepID=UPI00164F2FE2|nr:glycosyltransferase [Pontibacter beigongshangensis]
MIFSVAYFIVFFLLFATLLVLFAFYRKSYPGQPASFPRVSILIAARNEAHTITRCLQAIEQLQYPKEQLEVIIGDDASTDDTRTVVDAFIKNKPQYRCIPVSENLGLARGKANVLAHLAREATTDYFFFTDADIVVPPTWITSMLASLQPGLGVVTGITTIAGTGLFARLQAMDWIYALGLMQVVTDLGLPVSTMGNNMLLTRKAYEATGGYEQIKFSVTEDVAIFNKVLQQGFGFRNLYDRKVLAFSEPAPTLPDLLRQRRRWMRGSMHLPFYMVVILVLHAAYYPVWLPFFLYTSIGVMMGIFGLKLLLQSIYLRLCLKRVQLPLPPWPLYLLFELYLIFTSVLLILYFLIPSGVSWKGRRF